MSLHGLGWGKFCERMALLSLVTKASLHSGEFHLHRDSCGTWTLGVVCFVVELHSPHDMGNLELHFNSFFYKIFFIGEGSFSPVVLGNYLQGCRFVTMTPAVVSMARIRRQGL